MIPRGRELLPVYPREVEKLIKDAPGPRNGGTVKRNLAYYHALPYTKVVEREEKEQEAYFVVRIEELPGCIATGPDPSRSLAEHQTGF